MSRPLSRLTLLAAAVAVATVISGCGSSPCTVKDNGDGTTTISCPDGTSAVVRNGTPGNDCTVVPNADGTATLVCEDGTSTVIRNGTDGVSGEDAPMCQVTNNPDGSATISCPDGSTATITDGTSPLIPNPTILSPYENLPGVVVTVTSVTGGTDVGGTFKPGDQPVVTFTLTSKDNKPIKLSELSSISALLSGPTSNYQRVIGSESNVLTTAQANVDGSYTYTFKEIPATYLAPLNDSPSFGAGDGELTGQPLVPGTYTIGFQYRRVYSISGAPVNDNGNTTYDVGFLGATALTTREVIKGSNCNQCHDKVQAHGGGRVDVKFCVLCHTSGSEDKNVNTATFGFGTPGVSIDFAVLIHKVHNAAHLPSVLGVTTDATGARDYTAAPKPYLIGGYRSADDYSAFAFPVMPSGYKAFLYNNAGDTYTGVAGNGPMPRDDGYAALPAAAREKEDHIRTGLVECAKCHGDPDGAGPLTAPAQGAQHETNQSRKACGSCHDDIDWSKPYVANKLLMPPQTTDQNCTSCHLQSGTPLSVRDAHTHPYTDPAKNTGVNVTLTSVGGGTGTGGKHQAGDPIEVAFSVKDDAGADLDPHKLLRFQWMVNGPTTNPQPVVPAVVPFDGGFRKSSPFSGNGTISGLTVGATATRQTIAVIFTSSTTFDVVGTVTAPLTGQTFGAVNYDNVAFTVNNGAVAYAANDRYYLEVLPTAASYTARLPMDWAFERVGVASGGSDVFNVANTPLYWGRQVVFERTAVLSGGSLTADAKFMQRYVEADSSALALAVGDRVVLARDTAREEYLAVGWIEELGTSDKIWFTAASRFAHPSGDTLEEVTLSSRREGTHYTVSNAATGEITLLGGFTAGNPVLVSYRSDARFGFKRGPGDALQTKYWWPAADSEDVGFAQGEWKGLSILDGTYTVGAWVNRDFTVSYEGNVVPTEPWNNWGSDNTTYRMINKPATKNFLYGAATTVKPRAIVSSGDTCNACHTDLQAHGNGRRGLETCLMCHTTPGMEDGPRSSFSAWFVGATPGANMEFRSLIHKVHAGKELNKGEDFIVNGVFLGVPYPVQYNEIGFPNMPGGVSDCATCHGTSNAWKAPAAQSHPEGGPVRAWNTVCGACHDSDAATAHIQLNTYSGFEACEVCHGPGREVAVEQAHKVY